MTEDRTVTIEVDSTVRACARHLHEEFPALYSELGTQIGEAQRLLYQAEQKLQLAQHYTAIIQGAEKLCSLGGFEMIPLKPDIPVMLDKAMGNLDVLTKSISSKVTP